MPTNLPRFGEFVALIAMLTSLTALAIDTMLPALTTIGHDLLGYLSSAQQILQIQYSLGERFPLYFALLALAIGGASLLNAKLVMRYGMHWISTRALLLFTLLSGAFWFVTYSSAGHPALPLLMAYFMLAFLALGILFGNLNALAMEPLGHIAGIGASVIGSLSTLIAIPLGTFVGQAYDGTILPLISGFLIFGLAATAALFSQRKPA